jgi:hypothetical protein
MFEQDDRKLRTTESLQHEKALRKVKRTTPVKYTVCNKLKSGNDEIDAIANPSRYGYRSRELLNRGKQPRSNQNKIHASDAYYTTDHYVSSVANEADLRDFIRNAKNNDAFDQV